MQEDTLAISAEADEQDTHQRQFRQRDKFHCCSAWLRPTRSPRFWGPAIGESCRDNLDPATDVVVTPAQYSYRSSQAGADQIPPLLSSLWQGATASPGELNRNLFSQYSCTCLFGEGVVVSGANPLPWLARQSEDGSSRGLDTPRQPLGPNEINLFTCGVRRGQGALPGPQKVRGNHGFALIYPSLPRVDSSFFNLIWCCCCEYASNLTTCWLSRSYLPSMEMNYDENVSASRYLHAYGDVY